MTSSKYYIRGKKLIVPKFNRTEYTYYKSWLTFLLISKEVTDTALSNALSYAAGAQ